MKIYQDLLYKILLNGVIRKDRTGTGTYSLFGERLEFDLSRTFPAVTTKKLYFHGVKTELLWILSGSTNIKYLRDNKVSIWDEWADNNGDLGPTYGAQVRNFNNEGIDQIKSVINLLKNDPYSRRIIITLNNPAQESKMALPPCISMIQFYVNEDKLSAHVYQRSCDIFLGGPFDIAEYSLLTCMLAKVTGYKPDRIIFSYGDVHIYQNHTKQVIQQLGRIPYPLPRLKLADKKDIFDFNLNDIELIDYKSHPIIKAPIAI